MINTEVEILTEEIKAEEIKAVEEQACGTKEPCPYEPIPGELWKDIAGYEGLYRISNLGRLISNSGRSWSGRYNGKDDTVWVEKKPNDNGVGYLVVTLYKRGQKPKGFSIHKLVALHFVPNPDNLPVVNHKDENKMNNKADNLEWVTQKQNVNYGTAKQRAAESRAKNPRFNKKVAKLDLEGNVIEIYKNCLEAAKANRIQYASIWKCCKNRSHYNTAGGFQWKYIKPEPECN